MFTTLAPALDDFVAPVLVVRLEIEAVDETGFDEQQIRTVSENARTLKFEQSGFEET